jgi:CRP/FNR family transcriptional regulator, cyclic AMP receptor protein
MDLTKKFQRVDVQGRKLADILDETRWSDDFRWEELVILGSYIELFSVAEGTVLFEQGDQDLFLCLITDGEVSILKEDSRQENRPLATIGKDKTLGEMALIDNHPRSASAVASEDTMMFILTKQRFEEMADVHPRVWGALLLKFGKLMSQRLRETSGVLIDHLDS